MEPARPARRIAIALLALLYALLFAEAYLRVFGSRIFGDRGRSYVHRPWQNRVVLGVPFRTNGWGLRGAPFTARALRIVAFGGSATESAELPEEESWPARVERHLNDRAGARIGQVANAGSAGLSSAHYLAHLVELSGPINLDVAVVYSGTNDADRLARYGRILRVDRMGDRAYREAFFQAFIAPDPERLAVGPDVPILERSYFFLFLRGFVVKSVVQPTRNRLEDRLPGRSLSDKRKRLRASPGFAAVLRRAQEDYTQNLRLMLDVARARGVTPVFVSMPTWGDTEPELAALNRALEAFCREAGAPLVDLAAEPPPPGGWYRPASHHFTGEAADAVGARIARVIGDLLEGKRAGGEDLRRRARERALTLAARGDVR